MKKRLKLITVAIKATIFWNLLMVLLWLARRDPVLLEAALEITEKLEVVKDEEITEKMEAKDEED